MDGQSKTSRLFQVNRVLETQVIENLHMDLRHDSSMMREAERALVLYVQTVATMEFNEQSRQPAENPIERVLREGTIVGLANHTVLVSTRATLRTSCSAAKRSTELSL